MWECDFKSFFRNFAFLKLTRLIFKVLEGTNKAAKRREKYGSVSFDKIQGMKRSELICNLYCFMTVIASERISSGQLFESNDYYKLVVLTVFCRIQISN